MEENGGHRQEILKMDSIEGDEFVNYFSEPPTLQRMATVSIAIYLWTQPEARRELIEFSFMGSADRCELEERTFYKLLNSSIPTLLKSEISYVIRPIKLQLLRFFDKYRTGSKCYKKIYEHYKNGGSIYWTTEGTIDEVKSFKELCNNENSKNDVCLLYEAGCFFCLGENISDLWKKVPAHRKSRFNIVQFGDMYDQHIVLYWTSVLENILGSFQNKVIRIDYDNIYDLNLSVDLNMIACSVRTGNIFALKYFWKNLTKQEENNHLKKWLLQAMATRLGYNLFCQRESERLDVLCFLLSRVSAKVQVTEFFQNYSRLLIPLFENWPSQRFFLPTILDTLDNLQEDAYVSIMERIGLKVTKRGIEMRTFKEIWSNSPSKLKRTFLKTKEALNKVMLKFLKFEDLSSALMLLKDTSGEEKKQIVCYMFGTCTLRDFIRSNDLNLLCTFLSQTTLPSDCNPYSFSREKSGSLQFNEPGNWHICNEWLHDAKFQTIETFLNWAFSSADEIQYFKKTNLNPHRIYIAFIIMDKYEHVDQFLNWYFETEDEVRRYKRNFLRENNNSKFKSLLSKLRAVPTEMQCYLLEKFITFNLFSTEEITEFKFICFNCVEFVVDIHAYELATMLLKFSLDSMDQVKRYKNDFVLSKKGIEQFLPFINTCSISDSIGSVTKNIIEWCSPLSKETVTELKSLIRNKEASYLGENESDPNVVDFLDLLDSVVDKESNSEFVSNPNCDCHQATNEDIE